MGRAAPGDGHDLLDQFGIAAGDAMRRPQFPRELQAVFVQVDRDHLPRPGAARRPDRRHADRACPEYDDPAVDTALPGVRPEEHTSELQSLIPITYAHFCLKKPTL